MRWQKAMANVAGKLSDPDKVLALYQGLLHVSDETSSSAPRIALAKLETDTHSLAQLKTWFRYFQMLEAAFQQAEELDEARAQMTLVAASRYLAAHAPTARARRQTANLALRLHRGDDLSADNPDEAVD